jgi:hypothetical protein
MAQKRANRKLALPWATDTTFSKIRSVDVKNPSEWLFVPFWSLSIDQFFTRWKYRRVAERPDLAQRRNQ